MSVSNTQSAEVVAKELKHFYSIAMIIDHKSSIDMKHFTKSKLINATILARHEDVFKLKYDLKYPIDSKSLVKLERAKIMFFDSFERVTSVPTTMKLKNSYFILLCNYYNNLLFTNPDLKTFFSFNTPFFPWDILLKEVIQLHGLKYLSFHQTKDSQFSFITSTYGFDGKRILNSKNENHSDLKNFSLKEGIFPRSLSVKSVTQRNKFLNKLPKIIIYQIELVYKMLNMYLNQRRLWTSKWIWDNTKPFKSSLSNLPSNQQNRLSLILLVIRYFLRAEKNMSIVNKYKMDLNDTNFSDIYFSLHLEPEGQLVPRSYPFQDQLSAILMILACMPKSSRLIIKRHPLQSTEHSWRDIRQNNFLESYQLQILLERFKGKVFSLDDNLISNDIISRFKCVASFDGTINYESFLLGVPSISFIESVMDGLPNHFLIKSTDELKSAFISLFSESHQIVNVSDRERVLNKHEESISQYLINFPINKHERLTKQRVKNICKTIFKAFDEYTAV